jgi:antitoxin (DNA-binding transcriptional repressor) of toxin-antitoxin stability system
VIKTTLTKLRQHTRNYFEAVEKGETIEVYRYGKPIAEVRPLNSVSTPSWKNPGLRLKLNGASLSRAILNERAE